MDARSEATALLVHSAVALCKRSSQLSRSLLLTCLGSQLLPTNWELGTRGLEEELKCICVHGPERKRLGRGSVSVAGKEALILAGEGFLLGAAGRGRGAPTPCRYPAPPTIYEEA